MTSAGRRVIRNRRFQVIGVVSTLLAIGFATLTYVVIVSPGESLDHPGGFTSGGRALALGGCILVAVVFGTYGAGALRVALIIDETGLVIRNPWRTTTVGWDSKPRFETRDRRQDVTVVSPRTDGAPWNTGRMTYRYGEIICSVGRQRTWIAASSRMRNRDRVADILKELRDASSQFAPKQHRDVPEPRS